MVARVLCFQSAKLSKAFDFNEECMRARQVIQNLELRSLSVAVMFLGNSVRMKKKNPLLPNFRTFFLG